MICWSNNTSCRQVNEDLFKQCLKVLHNSEEDSLQSKGMLRAHVFVGVINAAE